MSDTLIAGPAPAPLTGSLQPPGDKSISHRAVMLAALADGDTRIGGFLPGEDNLATARMFSQMGVRIEWLDTAKTALQVHGVGLRGLKAPEGVLDAGNSGTAVRLMTGVLAGQSFASTLDGDASLRRRPMRRVVEPVRRMGARVEGRDGGEYLPLTIHGGALHGIDHVSPVASAQVKSCVLLAGLYAEGLTCVREPRPSRDHTERMLPLFGQPVEVRDNAVTLMPVGRLVAPDAEVSIPADPSSASFFAVAASLVPGSEIYLRGLGVNPRRDGWRRILSAMGGAMTEEGCTTLGEEPVADIVVSHTRLHGLQVDSTDVADAIDEFPILFVAAALAEGEFTLCGAGELRVKESDRIASMAACLAACGVEVREAADGIRIRGRDTLRGGVSIDAMGDHRIAMAMAVAAQCATGAVEIRRAGGIHTSFPGFVDMARAIGMQVAWA